MIFSVIVITYQSEKFIIETLESIKKQNYKEIELIISDDASQDRTIEICQKWLAQNHNRFIRTKIITSPRNTMITRNCNRGVNEATGEWVRLIAGDDFLTPDAFDVYLHAIETYPRQPIFFFQSIPFKETIDNCGSPFPEKNFIGFWNQMTVREQCLKLMRGNVLAANPIIRKSFLEKMEGYDENYPVGEDYPLWLKISLNQQYIQIIDRETMYYRLHEGSISQFTDVKNKNVIIHRHRVFRNIRAPYNPIYTRYTEMIGYWRDRIYIALGNKKYHLTCFSNFLFHLLLPHKYYEKLSQISKSFSKNFKPFIFYFLKTSMPK